jgi:hypothetical protein
MSRFIGLIYLGILSIIHPPYHTLSLSAIDSHCESSALSRTNTELTASHTVKTHPDDELCYGFVVILALGDSLRLPIDKVLDVISNRGDINRLLNCRVLSVQYRKERDGIQHEYLLIEIEIPGVDGHTYIRRVRLDRNVTTPSPSGSSASLPQSSHDLLGAVAGLHATDTIMFTSAAESTFHSSNLLSTLTFQNARRERLPDLFPDVTATSSASSSAAADPQSKKIPSCPLPDGPMLLDLISTMYTLSLAAPRYRVYWHSCYWMTGMLYEVLCLSFPGHIHVNGKENSSVKRGSRILNGRTFRIINEYGQINIKAEDEVAESGAMDRGQKIADSIRRLLHVNDSDSVALTQLPPSTPIPTADDSQLHMAYGSSTPPPIRPAVVVRKRAHEHLLAMLGQMQDPKVNRSVSCSSTLCYKLNFSP